MKRLYLLCFLKESSTTPHKIKVKSSNGYPTFGSNCIGQIIVIAGIKNMFNVRREFLRVCGMQATSLES